MKVFRMIAEQFRHSRLYRMFLLLLGAGFLKQCADYTALIDSGEYLQAAHNLLKGHWSACGELLPCGTHWLEATRRTPGYPLLILLCGFLPLLLIAVQVVLAAFIPVWSLRLLGQLTHTPRAHQLLMAAFVLYPLQFFYSNMLMPELWAQALLLRGIINMAARNYRPIPYFISALMLLKPVFILLLPCSVALLFVPHPKRMLQLLPLLLFLFFSMLHKTQTGWFHYSSMAVENAYEYNLRALMNKLHSEVEVQELQRSYDAQLQHMNTVERADFMQHISRDKIGSHLPLYLYLHARGALAALLDPGRYDLVAFLKLPQGKGFMGIKERAQGLPSLPVLLYMGLLLLWRLLLLALALRWLLRCTDWRLRLLLLLPLLMMLAAAGPVGSARYLFPVAPLIFVMAAGGFAAKKPVNTR